VTLDLDPEVAEVLARTSDPRVTADFHGGGYFSGHINHFDGTVARDVSASGVPVLSVEYAAPSPIGSGA
jgi:acetyl esterase/lipase